MKFDYDVLVIGLGPAGMAVSIMASEMGLKVCAIEKNKIGGECLNVGCVPSKSLLRMAKTRHAFNKLDQMELSLDKKPLVLDPLKKVGEYVQYINQNKTVKMFDKVDLILQQGPASFVNDHTVEVDDRKISAKKIFIATGTRPMVLPIPGIDQVPYLTNDNVFNLKEIPKSMTIIGGGAIGCEMAQAFARLGSSITIVHMDKHLIPVGTKEAGDILQKSLEQEGIKVLNDRKIAKVEKTAQGIVVHTDKAEELVSDYLLMGAGRQLTLKSLKLENAGIKTNKKGIVVNKYLQTNVKHIYGVGDCNGHYLLTHAAMHQGMIALINSMAPWPFKRDFKKYVVPWTVFTEPQVAYVGAMESELIKKKIKYQKVDANYEDYGAAIAENVAVGKVSVLIGRRGQIYGASIVGEGAGEMIAEWALAIQKKIKIYDIMMLQHSFPTMSFLNKRISEIWMMGKMKSKLLKKIIKWIY